MACGYARAVDRFVEMRHLDELVPDMGGAFHTIVVRDRRRGADQDVTDAGFADVAATVIACEAFDQFRGELKLSVQEDMLARNEHVFENDHRFLTGKPRV